MFQLFVESRNLQSFTTKTSTVVVCKVWQVGFNGCCHSHVCVIRYCSYLYLSYILMACKAVKMILRNFAPVIKSNLAAPPGPGIDINREERLVTWLQYMSRFD